MKIFITFLFFTVLFILSSLTADKVFAADKPIQHLQLPEVTSLKEAKTVFAKTTAELQSKKKLDSAELHQIHMTTYSLEKAVAYFADNLLGGQQVAAKKLAEVVELIHLASENNRTEETRVYLEDYSARAMLFAEAL